METLTTTEVVNDKLRVDSQCDKRCGRRLEKKRPTAALEEALRRTEDGAGMAPSSSYRREEQHVNVFACCAGERNCFF